MSVAEKRRRAAAWVLFWAGATAWLWAVATLYPPAGVLAGLGLLVSLPFAAIAGIVWLTRALAPENGV